MQVTNARPLSTELNDSYVDERVALEASSTALVMVDVWTVTDPMLLDNMHKRLLPLLSAARKLGFLIVHAPSEAPLWDQLHVLPGEILVTGERGDTARCDLAIKNASQTSHRDIKHVLLVGYDTNLCVIDKPCGAVQLSTELLEAAEVLLVRDTTRPGPDEYGNPYYTTETNINMIESGAWLPRGQQHIRSLVLRDLLVAFGYNAEANALPPLAFPVPQMSHRNPAVRPFTLTLEDVQSNTALVVVAAADNFDNDGYQARVNENSALWLLPLLISARAAKLPIIHLPNGRHLAHAPNPGEFVLNSTAQFAQVVRDFSFTNLLYCGYAANRELMWGDGGLAHFYAYTRYGYSPFFPAVAKIPKLAWIPEATIGKGHNTVAFRVRRSQCLILLLLRCLFGAGLENKMSIEGQWGLKMALAYRGFGGQIAVATLHNLLCAAQRTALRHRTSDLLYSLPGTHTIATAKDTITDNDIGTNENGKCGVGTGLVGPESVTIDLHASPASIEHKVMADKKIVCFVKSIGTPWAVYQLKVSDEPSVDGSLGLQYQTADAKGWHTISVPGVFRHPVESVRVTVEHDNTTVRIYRNAELLSTTQAFPQLNYDDATALLIGTRKGSEYWVGNISNIAIRVGATLSNGTRPTPPSPVPPQSKLDAKELEVLHTLHSELGGSHWLYRGNDVYHDGNGQPCVPPRAATVQPIEPDDHDHTGNATCVCGACKGNGARWLENADPCLWFGVMCDATGQHVTGLFPNPRGSGNPLVGQLPPAIGQLSQLQHFYSSNDETQSYLSGTLPPEFGALKNLKCMYFSHNVISGTIPKTFEGLANLEVFLMRCNHLSGPLIDFSRLSRLKNVWFDSQNLTGSLDSLSTLTNLTYLEASNNKLTGTVPPSLCELGAECLAGGNSFSCPLPQPGCCKVSKCGRVPALPTKTTSMGVCYPQ